MNFYEKFKLEINFFFNMNRFLNKTKIKKNLSLKQSNLLN
jgi:hypothetical protein